MKNKFFPVITTVVLIAFLINVSGCFGSFSLLKEVYKFNKGVGDKWVQEVVFLAMCIIPVYGGSALIDVLILNTIEFWTGKNPIASTVKSKDGEAQISFNTEDNSIIYTCGNNYYTFVKTETGTVVKDKNGNFLIECQLIDDGSMVLKNIDGSIVAKYTAGQVENLYSLVTSVK